MRSTGIVVRNAGLALFGFAFATLLACGGGGASNSTGTTPLDTGFVVSGSPAGATGATWTYKGTSAGVTYDLTGVLYKPTGAGPFPAVVLSHGHDGTAPFYASLIAPTMVSWGLVCIGVNYTHAAGVPIGSPGTSADSGASLANVERAHMTYELLRKLGYVDMTRVAAHGHSMGAFVTVALLGAYPNDVRALPLMLQRVHDWYTARGMF